MPPNTKAALLYIPPILALLAIWFGLLFTETSPTTQALDMLHFCVAESPNRAWVRWLLLLPALCAGLGIAHLTPLAHKQSGRAALFLAGAVLAAASWFTVSIDISVFATLPLLYAFIGAYRH